MQGKQKKPSVETLRSPLSAKGALSCYQKYHFKEMKILNNVCNPSGNQNLNCCVHTSHPHFAPLHCDGPSPSSVPYSASNLKRQKASKFYYSIKYKIKGN